MEEFDLIDILQERHPEAMDTLKEGYWTLKCKNYEENVGRLDYFLISTNVYP